MAGSSDRHDPVTGQWGVYDDDDTERIAIEDAAEEFMKGHSDLVCAKCCKQQDSCVRDEWFSVCPRRDQVFCDECWSEYWEECASGLLPWACPAIVRADGDTAVMFGGIRENSDDTSYNPTMYKLRVVELESDGRIDFEFSSLAADIRGRFRNGPNQCGCTADSALAFIPDLNEVVVAGGDGINNHLPLGWGSDWVQAINVTTSVVRALPNLPRITRGCRLAHHEGCIFITGGICSDGPRRRNQMMPGPDDCKDHEFMSKQLHFLGLDGQDEWQTHAMHLY